QRRECGTHRDILPVTWLLATDGLVLVMRVNMGEFVLRVHLGRLPLDLLILGTGFACQVAIGAKTPGVSPGEPVARLIVEVDVIDLLDGAASEARLVLDEIFEVSAGGHLGVAMDGLIPGEVTAGEHGVHAGESTHIATHNAATGEEE